MESTTCKAAFRPVMGLNSRFLLFSPSNSGIQSFTGSLRHRVVSRSASGRVLGQDALQGAAVHLESACGLRDVAITQFEYPLDMLPAHPIGRHRVFGRLGHRTLLGE